MKSMHEKILADPGTARADDDSITLVCASREHWRSAGHSVSSAPATVLRSISSPRVSSAELLCLPVMQKA
jgi:hypothetical protein